MRLPVLREDAPFLVFALWYLLFWALAFTASCYDMAKVPPCSTHASWPDPCYGITETVSDAGKGDAR